MNKTLTKEGLEYIASKVKTAGTLKDVKVDGSSVVTDGIASIQLKTIGGEVITGEGDIEVAGEVTLNGEKTEEASFYAPITVGTAGQMLKSTGTGAPVWAEAPSGKMTLNGLATTVDTTSVNIYAPITPGTVGQVLKSNGFGAPVWSDGGGGSGEMTVNDEVKEVSAALKVYTPKDSGTKAKMLVGNETTNTPTWETSCRSVTLTKAEYDDLSTTKKSDPNIIYYITDDVAGTTEDPSIRWSETLKSSLTSATDKQVYTAKAMNDFIADVKSEVFNIIYPIGSYAFGSKPSMGTWTQVTGDRALWLKNTVNDGTTIAEGLPDIQGSITASTYSFASDTTANITNSGALSVSGSKKASSGESSAASYPNKISFKASDYNKSTTVYGKTTNVQPNAYVMTV